MVFSSPIFICVFLPLVLAAYYALPKSANNAVLVGASLIFYAWGDPLAALFLVIPSVVINFHFGKLIGAAAEKRRRHWIVTSAITFNLALLVAFKYLPFIVTNVNIGLDAIGITHLRVPGITLPLGISFFTFHIISYLVDIYRGLFPPQPSLAAFTLYILNFPQLIAGPIIRYKQMVDQLGERFTTFGDIEYGTVRFVTGLAKKLLIADPIGQIANTVFDIPATDLTAGSAWLGVVCYALQIYFDFSGYSDMAIGLARMFGFRFPENFNYPYAADSIQDFWRRWHMTLSAWFRDYVYIPLGGNRLGPWDTVRNLWLVFLLTGAWHGASWNFVIWGLWHGMFLSLERLGPVARTMERMPRVLRTGYVLLIVLIGWVFFRAATLDQALLLLKRMIVTPAGAADLIDAFMIVTPRTLVMLALAFTLTLPLWPLLRERWQRFINQRWPTLGDLASAAYVAFVMLLAFGAIASEQNSPFLYFRF